MNNLSIKVTKAKIRYNEYKKPYCLGEITINDFSEEFDMSLLDWNINDYEKQWQEGLERIKHHKTSCLITSISDLKNSIRFIDLWVLFKEDNKIFIQNRWLFGENYMEIV